MSDREPMHPNLADALEAEADDAAALDAIARRLAGAAPIDEIPPAPTDLAARVRAALEAGDDAGGEAGGEVEPLVEEAAEVVDLRARRRPRWLPAVAVAAAAAVVAFVVGVTITDGGDDVERQEVAAHDRAVEPAGGQRPNFPSRRRAAAARSILESCGT